MCLSFIPAMEQATATPTEGWIRQLGTAADDRGYGVSADGQGNVYITGYTKGSLGGTNMGYYDAFLSKYSSSGNLVWCQQLGTSLNDYGYGVSADGQGNVYIAGATQGSLGGTSAGTYDAFLSKYDSAGNLAWTRQLGTTSGDYSYSVSADGQGNMYITGYTDGSLGGTNAGGADAFLGKYDSSGNPVWTKQLGTAKYDYGYNVWADIIGNVYLTGATAGSLFGTNPNTNYDPFLGKYDSSGNLVWSCQLGTTSSDYSYGVSVDGLGNVYIAGYNGSLMSEDVFLSKYDSSGNFVWTQQLGTASRDFSYGVWADTSGNVFITGSLGGTGGAGDAFIAMYDSAGNLTWSDELETSSYECGRSVSGDGLGNVYITGYSKGSLSGTNAGNNDIFIVKYIPEPATICLLGLGALGLLRRRRK